MLFMEIIFCGGNYTKHVNPKCKLHRFLGRIVPLNVRWTDILTVHLVSQFTPNRRIFSHSHPPAAIYVIENALFSVMYEHGFF